MNQYNNDTLEFRSKIVATKFFADDIPIDKLIEHISTALKSLYGIVILLFGHERYMIVTSDKVQQKTILVAKRLLEEPEIENELDIIPFPKL